jgi:hypothetical protein
MPLPQIMFPQFDIVIPSTKKKSKFRQFLVKEEKILLVAKSSDDDNDTLTAIKQVVQNCSLDPAFDANKITIFDLEYIFLKLRALSVNNIVNLSYRDYEDDVVYDFQVNLDDIDVVFPKNVDPKIEIQSGTGIVMRYPPASLYGDKEFLNSKNSDAVDLIIRCVDKIFDTDTVYDPSSYTKEQLVEFVENLDIKTFEKINEFLSNSPKMTYEIKYKNSLGNNRSIVLNTLNDFFTLR